MIDFLFALAVVALFTLPFVYAVYTFRRFIRETLLPFVSASRVTREQLRHLRQAHAGMLRYHHADILSARHVHPSQRTN